MQSDLGFIWQDLEEVSLREAAFAINALKVCKQSPHYDNIRRESAEKKNVQFAKILQKIQPSDECNC